MPSMASMILRAAREAARAARSAASAASRCAAAAAAALACSGSGGAPASGRPLMHGSSSVALPLWSNPPIAGPPPSWSSLSSHDSGSTFDPPPPLTMPNNDRPEFVADEKDLESDEALWALYERWCKEFDQPRDRDEMAQRFSMFKDTVLMVQENKKAGLPYTLEITKFADGKLMDLRRPVVPIKEYVRMMPHSDSVIYGRATDFRFTENLKRRKLQKSRINLHEESQDTP